MASPEQLYPLSSQDGTPIPIDAIRPITSWWIAVVTDGPTALPVSLADELYVIYSTVPAFLSFTGEITAGPVPDDTVIDDTVFLPAHTQMTIVAKAGTGSAISMGEGNGSGRIYATKVERWSGLGTVKQASFR